MGELRILADAGSPQLQHPIQILRGGIGAAARLFAPRHTLAGEHGFIHAGAALYHFAIDGNTFARAHDANIACLQLLNRHIQQLAVALDARRAWLHFDQRFNRNRGLTLSACLQEFAEQDQRDDGAGGFEVHMQMRETEHGHYQA